MSKDRKLYKALSRLLHYFPFVMVLCTLAYLAHSFYGVHSYPLFLFFGISLLPTIIIYHVMIILKSCWYNRASLIYSCISSCIVYYTNIYGPFYGLEVIRIIFFIIGILLFILLIILEYRQRTRNK